MLSLTRKTDYALVALAYLGQQLMEQETAADPTWRPRGLRGETPAAAGGTGAGGVVSARQIAQRFGLPLPLLMNILKALSHAGLVTSIRGPLGGYTLVGLPRDISVLDVVHAIEGPVRMVPCTPDAARFGAGQRQGGPQTGGRTGEVDAEAHRGCPADRGCPIKHPIQRLNRRLTEFLAGVTLADLMGYDTPAGVTHGLPVYPCMPAAATEGVTCDGEG